MTTVSFVRCFGRCVVAAVVIACVTPDAVLAQATKPKADPDTIFKRRDADGDGFLSESEFLAAAKDDDRKEKMKKRFGKIDTNGDGKLSLDEFKAGMKGPAA